MAPWCRPTAAGEQHEGAGTSAGGAQIITVIASAYDTATGARRAAAANVARAIAVMAPREIQVARRRKRLFISELNDAPSADDGCVFECQKHDSAVPQKRMELC